ncbi:Hypp2100 [Branchiostoma lanceolatum]|uniref:Hypp2100 protein n=1 Tax=Branchiostoma lanceolatum TaxID=7740 RepID=A0A8K0ERF9_BRALA|nr:Hypp2100 [Branchiostoma lanceolatum]
MRCLRRILELSLKDKIPNSVILQQAKIQSIYSILSQRRFRWLGHVRRMEDGRIPKDVLYGQLAIGSRRAGRPALRFKDACKRDMKACDISTDTWEVQAEDRTAWRRVVHHGVMEADKRRGKVAEKRRQQKTAALNEPLITQHPCSVCNRVCKSRAELSSHIRSHKRTPEAHR